MSKKELSDADIEKMRRVGIDEDENTRTGTFTVIDDEIDKVSSRDDGVEILGLPAAMKKYDDVKKMLWSLVDPHKDEYTKEVYRFEQEKHPVGQFLRIKSGTKSKKPFQSCFFIKLDRFTQTVHNIIVIEDDVEFHIISGCAVASYINDGMHIGITEIFIGKNSTLSYTMIHDWAPGMIVRPRTGITVDENSHFISNYISLRATKMTQMYPEAHLVGEKASARFTSLILSPENSIYDLGSRVYLSAPKTSAEIISRAISSGGDSISRGHIIAEAPQTRGHLECNGLFIVEGGIIDAVPQLTAKVQDTDLSHEAALGKIDEEKLEYLMARGLSREQSTQMIIKGFLDVGILGLPPALEEEVQRNMELMEAGAF
ncbi:SufD family Fe-S cluster assembly protein [bacterium]|nr:SufD family Fe-S cluster assembly protein [bacterium]